MILFFDSARLLHVPTAAKYPLPQKVGDLLRTMPGSFIIDSHPIIEERSLIWGFRG